MYTIHSFVSFFLNSVSSCTSAPHVPQTSSPLPSSSPPSSSIMSDSKNGCLHSGCLCCYTACDFEKMVPGCVGTHDCLCIRHSFCCAVDVPPRGLGITTNKEDEICKLGLFCCDIGIITPSALWAGVHQHCCCYA